MKTTTQADGNLCIELSKKEALEMVESIANQMVADDSETVSILIFND